MNKAFTLIELLVVIAVIGILSTAVLVYLGGTQEKAVVAQSLKFSESVYHTLGFDLAGKWDFDNSATDTSGYGRNLTLYNGAAYSTTTPQSVVGSGSGKYSLSLDGSNDYASVPDAANLTLGNAVTVEAWVNFRAISNHVSDQHRIAYKFAYPTAGWYLYYHENGYFNFSTYDGSSHEALYYLVPKLNTWYHVVGVSNGTSNIIYVNGAKGNTVPSGTLTNSVNGLYVGGYGDSNYSLNGLVDDLRVYNYALSFSEIKKHYAQKSLKYSGVLGIDF